MSTNNARQAAWIGVGSICSFAFGIVSSMILSRYIPKADYGTYKQVLYVYETLVVVFTLGLPRAYSFFLPKVDISQAKDLIKKISLLFLLMGGLMSLLLFVCADYIGELLNNLDLPDAIRLFSVVPTLLLPTMGLDGILATFQKAKLMALYNVISKCIMLTFVALPVLFFNFGYKEAIEGFVMASLLSFFVAEFLIFYPLRRKGNNKCNLSYVTIFSFSLPLLFASLWAIIQNSADSFFISRYYGKEVFAEFANGNMELPFVGMIIGACATVLSPVFSRLSSQNANPRNEIMPIWKSVFEKSAMLIYPLVLYFIVFADVLMVFLYGSQYEISADYFRVRTAASFFNVIAVGPLLINIGYVRSYSIVQMMTTICLVVLDFIVIFTVNSPLAISYVQLFCRIGCIIVYLMIIAKYFNVNLLRLLPLGNLVKVLLTSIFLLLVLKLMTCYFDSKEVVVIIISFLLYAVSFCLLSYVFGIDYKKIILSFKR